MIKQEETIIIPLSKKKIRALIVGSVIFILLAAWIWVDGAEEAYYNKGFASIALVFFGATTIYGIVKLQDKKPGLIIHKDYLAENTNLTGGNVIAWEDIVRLDIAYVKRVRLLMVIVRNPEEYIKRKKGIARFFMQVNFRYYGSPLSISSVSLQCEFNEMVDLIAARLNPPENEVSTTGE